MITKEDFADFKGHKIWYRTVKSSNISDSTAPILLLHGGPGLGSDYLEPLERLADQGHTVIRFDQLGGGRSDRPRDVSIWTLQGCIGQIDSIRAALGLDRIHLLGHSWGGMVALEYLLTRPSGVQSTILCSPVVSVQGWSQGVDRLRLLMPSVIGNALVRCAKSLPQPIRPALGEVPPMSQEGIDREARSLSSLFSVGSWPPIAWLASLLSYLPIPKFRNWLYVPLSIQFKLRHECRLKPFPFSLFRSAAGVDEDIDINGVLMGPSDFYQTGLLKDWDIRPSLSQIQRPTLILSGFYDKATLDQMAELRNAIAGSEQIILEQSSHCGMWEEPDKFQAAILDFINRVEKYL